MARRHCVVARSQPTRCFDRKSDALQYARTLARIEGKSGRVVDLGRSGRRRRRKKPMSAARLRDILACKVFGGKACK